MERFGLVNPEASQSGRGYGGRGIRAGGVQGEGVALGRVVTLGKVRAELNGAEPGARARLNRGEAERERAVLNGKSCGDEGGTKGRS